MTATVLASEGLDHVVGVAGPWAASSASTRWKYFQPFWASLTLVAEALTLGIPACSKIGIGGRRLTGEGGADDGDDLVADQLGGAVVGLGRVALAVEGVDGDLDRRVGGVVLG